MKVYHGQEWIGFENIPETDGALIIYYHGAVPVDYFCLVAELWLQRGREVHSVVDRSLMQIPYMDNLRKHMKLFPGTVDTCADLLEYEMVGLNCYISHSCCVDQESCWVSLQAELTSRCLETVITLSSGSPGSASPRSQSRPTSPSSQCSLRTSERTLSLWLAG